MAVLNKIRQRSLFLILIIALALFSFVLSDLFKNSSAFTGSQDIVATINGQDVNRVDFMNKVELAQRQLGPNGTSTQAMNRVWDLEVRKAIMKTQFDELGLTVEKDQMRDLLKNSFSSFPEFLNEAGVFDENKLNEFIANLKATAPTPTVLGGQIQINYDDWVDNEKSIAVGAQEQSYYNMIKAGITSTIGEAKVDYVLENEAVDVKFVQVPFTSISDSIVKVSKSEIEDYINANQKKFEVDASRDINFVEFKEVASIEDEEAIKNSVIALLNNKVEYNDVSKLNDTIIGLRETKDVENFINTYSDVKYNDNFVSKNTLPATVQDSIFKLGVGQYYGPYKDNGMFKISKVVAEKTIPDSVKVRHILIPFVGAQSAQPDVTQTEAEAKKTADSVLAVVKANKSKFPELVTALSSDLGSVEKGGEYDFHPYNTMVPEFNDFEFEGKTGDLGVVKTAFGFHIIEILGQKEKNRVLKIATLGQKIEPSEKTIDDVFNATSKFEIAIQDKDFQEVATKNSYEVKPVNGIKELDENIPGLGSQRSIVRWAFEDGTKVGDYKRFSIPNGGFVVVQLSASNKKGLMSVEAASVTAIPEIRKEKKAKMIREKIAGKSMDAIASSQNVTVQNASAVNMKNPTLSGAGNEPLVVGNAFGLKVGQKSKLIDGNNGVYMIEVTNKTEAPKLDNYQAVANRLTAARVGAAQVKVYNALKEAAEIEDNRAKFY
ncbi:peptidylprolyl isomerase [Aquaticitalea lipolytica]|jgi:peptidyl-prolyl cis-trans isomerase D|uniref:Periplasmic chaperone PpiD n=1 Tax=Aquaticitalea lipolytica TaxID=1247562 RepID=A0A8J2X9E6_9FLAO|nr:peptidylprolyl isomerase [Aquaticitalea lipolytica]GFZ80961.1 peptidylprolyl isomerase [Aquaticitalea lipolytica]